MTHMDDFDYVVGFDHPIENLEPISLDNHPADAWNTRGFCCLRVPTDELDRRIDRRENVDRAFWTALN